MCFASKPPVDRSGELARQEAADREAKIREGRGNIDQAFSAFDPAYFDKYQQQYLDNYNPQIDEKFDYAKQGLTYDLARRRMQDSQSGFNVFKQLVDAYGDQRRSAASGALDAAGKLRQQIEQNRSDLYMQNSAAADPSLASITALSRAQSLQSPAGYNPLGDIFSGFLRGAGDYTLGRNKGLPAGYENAFAPGSPGGGGGGGKSGYTVP